MKSPGASLHLGATVREDGVTFRVWAPRCTRLDVVVAAHRERAPAFDDDLERSTAWGPHPERDSLVAHGCAQMKACAQGFHTVQLSVTDVRPGLWLKGAR